MLLEEIGITKQQAAKQIAQFVDKWARGHFHTDGSAQQRVPPGIFSLIRKFYPKSIYTGPLYRVLGIDGDKFLKASSPQQLTRLITSFKRDDTQMFSWAKTIRDVTQYMTWGLDTEEYLDDDDPHSIGAVSVLINQKTSHGIDIKKLEQELHGDHVSQASTVNEVMAPIEPPIHIQGYVVSAIVTVYIDDEMYSEEDADTLRTVRKVNLTNFKEVQRLLKYTSKGPIDDDEWEIIQDTVGTTHRKEGGEHKSSFGDW